VPIETTDEGYQVVLAFAGICIRLYQGTRDDADLRQRAYPYVRRVAEYALAELLIEEKGTWLLKGMVAHDVDTASADAAKQRGMLLWVLVSVSKCAE
jgi:hypothetical protein